MHSVFRNNYYKTFYMRYLPYFRYLFKTMVKQPLLFSDLTDRCSHHRPDRLLQSSTYLSRPAGVNVLGYKCEAWNSAISDVYLILIGL
jgi:hypothetical protein